MISQDIPKNIPDTPGVYFFLRQAQDKSQNDILYIGKATSLKNRIKSYFSGDLTEKRGPKISTMIEEATEITWEETDSVLEALILESNLIKKYQPPYNTREKDNKSYNHIVITNEDFPRIFTVREREIEKNLIKKKGKEKLPYKIKYSFGPFPHGNTLREALRLIRKIFPFRDKKANQERQERFYTMLNLSPDSTDKDAREKYNKTIENIKLFFQGKKTAVIRNLEKEMKRLAKELKFEEAEEIKRQLFALQHIQDIALIKNEVRDHDTTRIEAYDVAHLQGGETVGVMTVTTQGISARDEYRKFKLRTETNGNDIAALEEILTRRLGHNEWELPAMIVVDGGVAQKRVAEKTLRTYGKNIPVISVVKDNRHKPKELRGQTKLIEKYKKDILLANAEAHRFAIKYHRDLRRKVLA